MDCTMDKLHTYMSIEIAQRAEKLLLNTGFSDTFPCPVEKIIASLGFSAHLFQPNSETQNVSGAVDHKNKKIYINANETAQRRLFTAAHEIGHIELHPQDDYIDLRDIFLNKEPKEIEADLFAACLLMPENVFRKQWKKYSEDIKKLSCFFGTSKAAISFRAEYLGLE